MAKLYGEIQASALMTFDKSFSRANGQPLDSTEVFYSKAAAEEYAATAVAYVGQKIVVIETKDDVTTVTHYSIEADNSLKELGSLPVGDKKSITVAEDGTISIVGFTNADEGAQPRKKADGTIEWVVPSTDTVDGLQTTVAGLQSDVKAIQDDYLISEDKTELEGKITTAQGDVDKLEEYVGTFAPVGEETTVVGYIDAKIGAIPEQTDYSVTVTESSPEGYAKAYTFTQKGATLATINIPKDMVVESGSVVTDPAGQAAGTYIKLVLANATEDELYINVSDLIEYITGDTAADGMITVTVDSATHVATATINDGTITLAKLTTEVQTAIGKAHEHNNQVTLDKITPGDYEDLCTWSDFIGDGSFPATEESVTNLATRVGEVEGKAHEHENENVLNAITSEKVNAWDAAEANVISSVDDKQFALDTNKNLTLLDIAMGKVTGLSDALAGKVDKVEGSRLITSDEADKLEKLVLGEDGSVEVSGKIAAGNVDGLAEWITARAGTLEGLSENNFSDSLLAKLEGIAEGAEVNYIKSVSNEFAVSAAGELSVSSVNVNKLTQTEGETLILNGGASAV